MAARDHGYRMPRADRVQAIARKMREGQWRRGDSAEMATAHGVPLHVSEHDAADAALALQVARALFAEEARAEVLRRLAAVLSG